MVQKLYNQDNASARFAADALPEPLRGVQNQKRFVTVLAERDDAGMTWKRQDKPLLPFGRPHSCDE